jgi:hypothetical protein
VIFASTCPVVTTWAFAVDGAPVFAPGDLWTMPARGEFPVPVVAALAVHTYGATRWDVPDTATGTVATDSTVALPCR